MLGLRSSSACDGRLAIRLSKCQSQLEIFGRHVMTSQHLNAGHRWGQAPPRDRRVRQQQEQKSVTVNCWKSGAQCCQQLAPVTLVWQQSRVTVRLWGTTITYFRESLNFLITQQGRSKNSSINSSVLTVVTSWTNKFAVDLLSCYSFRICIVFISRSMVLVTWNCLVVHS